MQKKWASKIIIKTESNSNVTGSNANEDILLLDHMAKNGNLTNE